MNFYELSKKSIKYQEIESYRMPTLYKSSFAKFDKYNLKEGIFYTNCSTQQILKFNKYILKRIIMDVFGKDQIVNNPDVESFKECMTNDFALSKIVWAHQCGVMPIDSFFTYIKNQSLLVYEFLSENPGSEFLKEYDKYMKETEHKFLFVKQLANFFSFLERFNLIYCDINFKNLFIDENGTLKIFSVEESFFHNSTNCNKLKEINKGFVSPEILSKYIKEKIYKIYKETKSENSNYYKSNIYSWGIFANYLFNFNFNSPEDDNRIGRVDQFKNSENNHNRIIENIKKIKFELNNVSYSASIQTILLNCLFYQSEKRISFPELVNLIENIDKLCESKFEMTAHNGLGLNLNLKPNLKSKQYSELSSSCYPDVPYLIKKSEDLNFSTASNSFVELFHKIETYDESLINIQKEKIFENFEINSTYIPILKNEIDWDLTSMELKLNEFKALFELLSLYPILSSLIICYYDPQKRLLIGKTLEIKKEEANILHNIIRKSKFIKQLKVGCTMEKESIKLICEALKDKQYLEQFEIGCYNVDDEDVSIITDCINSKDKLKYFFLYGEYISNCSVKALCNSLLNKNNLKRIMIIGPKINDLGIMEIVKALIDKTKLKYLYIAGGEMNIKDKIKLMFKNNKKILIDY